MTSAQVPCSASPLSPTIRTGDYLLVSGQVGVTPSTRETMQRIAEQTRRCLNNVKGRPTAGGTSLDKVVNVTVFMTNIKGFANNERCLPHVLSGKSSGAFMY